MGSASLHLMTRSSKGVYGMCRENTGRERLAMFRVWNPEGLDFFSAQMTPEQRSERRIYMRKALLPYPRYENLSNDELDSMRLQVLDNGILLEQADGRETFLKNPDVTERERQFRRMRAMMPFEFMGTTAADFRWDKYRRDIAGAKDLVNRYIVRYPQFKERGMGLYIYSAAKGSGKTMLACCLLNEIAKRHAGSVKFANILDFLEMTKKGFSGDAADIQAVRQAGLLVLDDIGVQLDREWINTVLYQLVNERYINSLPTIYTSNTPPEELRLDDRITDRIESTTYAVRLPDEPIRRQERQQEKRRILEEIENVPQEAPHSGGAETGRRQQDVAQAEGKGDFQDGAYND